MSYLRAFLSLCAAALLAPAAHADPSFGIVALSDQTIPSGKTLVVPIAATDPSGPARNYTVTVTGTAGLSGTGGGIMATIRTGDPHLRLTVTYTDSGSVVHQDQPMEFQLYREFCPLAVQTIAGLAEGGFYSPQTSGTTTRYITFHRVVPGQFIQGGDPNGDGTGGPGFNYRSEFSSALIFSATAGQLALANAGFHEQVEMHSSPIGNQLGFANANADSTNGSQFFITAAPERGLDFKHTIFGQLLRGYDTLAGIQSTPLTTSTSSGEFSSPVNPVNITSASVAANNTDAVLILSATGLADSVITVTATSAGQSASQTFTAHAIADTVNDPPFLNPVPDAAIPASPLKITLRGTDLQLDLLRYGYERLSPVLDEVAIPTGSGTNTVLVPLITSGTSPTLSIALPQGGNRLAAALDHWAGVYETSSLYPGAMLRPFEVAVGQKPLQGTLTPIPPAAAPIVLGDFPVAVITDGNKGDTPSSLAAAVNWGDGTLLSGTGSVNIVKDPAGHTVNRFQIRASHTYSAPGEYPVLVQVTNAGGARLTLTGTANVGANSIALSSPDFFSTGGKVVNKAIATFSDFGSQLPASAYGATIAWGMERSRPAWSSRSRKPSRLSVRTFIRSRGHLR